MVSIGCITTHQWSGNPEYLPFVRTVIEDSLVIMENLDSEGDFVDAWAMDISSMGVITLV